MTADELQHRLRNYPDILAGLIDAVALLEKFKVMLSLLREHFPPGQWAATAAEIDDHLTIYRVAIDRATTTKIGG